MKKGKRLIALGVVVALSICLTACGKSDSTYLKESKKLFTATKGQASVEFVLKADNLKDIGGTVDEAESSILDSIDFNQVGLKLDVLSTENNDFSLSVSTNLGDTGYVEATDIIFVSDIVYLNAQKAGKYVTENLSPLLGEDADETVEQITGMLQGIGVSDEKPYIGVPKELIQSLMQSEVEDLGEAGNGITSIDKQAIVSVINSKFLPMFDSLSDELVKSSPTVMGQDGDFYTLTVNNENAQGLVTSLKTWTTANKNELTQAMTELYKAIGLSEEEIADMTDELFDDSEEVDEIPDDFMENASVFVKQKIDGEGDDLKSESAATITFEDVDSHVELYINTSSDASADVSSVQAPADYVNASELMSMFAE